MSKSKYILGFTVLLIVAGTATNVLAQSNGDLEIKAKSSVNQDFTSRRIKRDIQPIDYWVDSASLSLRDNPVAGRVTGKINYGQKVAAYSQYENWVKVSKPGAKQQWVNSDFLSNSRLSWASYNRKVAVRSSDITAVRIKDPKNRKNRTFGVRLKTAETGNALITTRQDTAQGVFYQNRFVSCDDQKAVGVRLVGEGYSFLGAQNDVRGGSLDIYEVDQIDDKVKGSLETAITSFACKAQSF